MNFINRFFCILSFFCVNSVFSIDKDAVKYLQILHEISSIIQKDYIEDKNEIELYKGAIKGLISSLNDPYTQFLDRTDFQRFQEDESGTFGGLGIEVSFDNGEVIVVSPLDNTPAMKAGIQPNDKIIEIEGKATKDLEPNQSVNLLRGKVNTAVKIKVLRKNIKEPIEYTLYRDIIKIQYIDAKYMTKQKIAYIKLNQFLGNKETYIRFLKLLQKNIKKDTKGLIIDLRYNPGGLLNLSIQFSNLFLKSGKKIVSIKKKNEKSQVFYSTFIKEKWLDIPMVVLMNKGSASASEIFAGAMQDHKRATIIGEKSFGKGSVQNIISLSYGTALRMTVKRYYTPNNRLIQGKGIEPNIKVKNWDLTKKDKFFLFELQKTQQFKDFLKKYPKYTDENFKKLKTISRNHSLILSDEILSLFYRNLTKEKEEDISATLKRDKQLQTAVQFLNS